MNVTVIAEGREASSREAERIAAKYFNAGYPAWQEQRTVLAHGCFDLLHLGHIRHLQEAREQGDRLVVSVTDDKFVRKGQGRPVFTANQRVEALKALGCVDEVVINDAPDAVALIEKIKPAVFVKGVDYSNITNAALEREIRAVEAVGGRFHVTKTDKWSSSRIINGERLGDEVLAYVESARKRGFLDLILAAFERADKLKVAFVGETIVDEYRYVMPIGKPVKEFCLATVDAKESETFLGGVAAAAKHAEWPNVTVVTSNVSPIQKTRYVDASFNRKLFEVYSTRTVELAEPERELFRSRLNAARVASDVVVVFDFGHGLLNALDRAMLAGAQFFALNAQTNTANFGFNPVTKYSRADYVCIDEPEARLATAMQSEALPAVMRNLQVRIPCSNMVVTNGRQGCWARDPANATARHVPAFAHNGIDTMGAGDAFLAATAPLIAAGLDLEAAAMVGNVAGAIKVGIVGHRRHVARDELLQSVEALLK
jgi:rfaE bifunctional protein nucleotidyltransferase chain/domain